MNYFKNRYYAELKSTKWWAVRDKVLIRDNHKCTVCGSTKDLQVHHTFYYNNKYVSPFDYPLDSLITVCRDCHLTFHNSCEVELKRFPKITKVKVKKKRKKNKQKTQAEKWRDSKAMKDALRAERKIKAKYK